jgi:ABC-type transport system involved in multi-copper enzyme maturation permease subunit
MTWVTWRQYRYQGTLAAALLAALAVLLLITGLHAAWVWHSALAECTKVNSCGTLNGSLTLANNAVGFLVIATIAVLLLPGLFWGAPMVAHELETGTNQFAWTQSITRRRWLAVRTGWLLLGAAVLAGAVSALVTWWSGPNTALQANAFQANRFDIMDIVPVGYALFAMALGICAGTLLRRTLPALAVTLAGFVALRVLIAEWLRLHYMTPVTVYYKLTAPFVPAGSYLGISQGIVGANGRPPASSFSAPNYNGVPIPADCQQFLGHPDLSGVLSCLAAHGARGYVTYQPASRFWAFQGIETGIFVVLAAVLLGVTFWVLKRRDA